MKNYFTPVEFAKLFGIDKQTLIYYDNRGIFSPRHKNEKGYRFYGSDQILYFSTIVALRNLDIRGEQLRQYTDEPTKERLTLMLQDRIEEYEQQIQSLQQKTIALKQVMLTLGENLQQKAGKIMLIPLPRIYYQQSLKQQSKSLTGSLKEALLNSHLIFKEYSTRLLTDSLQLCLAPSVASLDGLKSCTDFRFLLLTEQEGVLGNALTIPAGVYLTYMFEGAFEKCLDQGICSVHNFLRRTGIQAEPLIFITKLWNYDTDVDEKFYIKLEIRVKY